MESAFGWPEAMTVVAILGTVCVALIKFSPRPNGHYYAKAVDFARVETRLEVLEQKFDKMDTKLDQALKGRDE